VGDPADGDGLAADGAVVGDPRGAGEVLAGVAEGLTECDGLGDRVGLGEVLAGEDAGEVGEGLVTVWVELAGAAVCAGATRM
jgi:hypothetical protein